ncbi:Peptidoglycan-binding protein [Rhizobium freirei PRF 81]|uniref:Peptidoglycan-binding protein n=1 Tax=Rhizobium freirei PRF 81 TaxID=363754 RepID=N6UYW5_9HYPH|nr:peptidoglycan-binding protein [Rhizobium freirei]ENN84022.1 Peptidoglycan-binding protein [Rhizobium freirei PRF 81]
MSGSRSNPTSTGDWTSLDALSRTIEGLEARIEDLMGTAASRDTRQRAAAGYGAAPERAAPLERMPPRPEREYPAGRPYERPLRSGRQEHDVRPDPLAEIRQRQRALEANRERLLSRREEIPQAEPQPARRPLDPYNPRQPQRPAAENSVDIAQALVNLRQDLKRDIADSVTREVNSLRAEIRDIRENTNDKHFAADVREDMARLADSINQLTGQPETAGLKAEFDELRSLMDGLAREESLHHVGRQVKAIDTTGLQDELVSLAYRLDDIKQHLGGMNDSPAVHALEHKLLTIATAMESLGSMMQPQDQAMQRLEGRLSGLADQIDVMSRDAARRQPTDDLSGRLEALAMRIDELGSAKAVARLEERLDQLSHLMERSQKAAPQPELVTYLADISHKIDALEHGSVGNVLADRLDYLARRIDEMDFHPPAPAANIDDGAVRRLEGRLSDIAARLEASTAAPPTDTQALRNLEEQIAHLSTLLTSEPRAAAAEHFPVDFDRRMSAIEDYMATNDEYIIEAARHAAETVVEAYSREGGMVGGAQPGDMAALTALAEDLRHLEDLSRASDERTHRTFEALHDTLLQIADRLDHMEHRRPAPTMPAATFKSDVFAQEDAPAIIPPMAAPQKAGPIIRTVAPAETAAAAETVVAQAIDANTKAEIKAAAKKSGSKAGLLANLGKRFFTPEKAEPIFPPDRPVIEQAPSIDPADMMPAEEANELLEPGSGAPDIKKILERVRASQNTARGGRQPTENERADYIAAARRAAQAAATEVDQAQRGTAPSSKKDAKTGGAFSRFRRPILLAIGAALLAIMAFPLVNTLMRGQKAPAPAEISTMAAPADSPATNSVAINAAPAANDQQSAANQAAAPTTLATDTAGFQPAAAPSNALAATSDHLTAAAPLDGNQAATETLAPAGSAPTAQQTAAFVPADKSAAAAQPAAAPAAADIQVPDGIQPPSLVAAAKSGDPVALFEIGARYTDGRNVATDLKQAASWYRLSADKGYAPAQYRLASMYEKGNGIDRDLVKAKENYEQAANQGNASAMHNLAVLYASGAAGQQDYDSAANWFTRAANLGVSDSQFNLAILYARGNGVKQDLPESYKWFAIAAKSGDKDAAQKRDEVANAMKPADLEGARAKVDLWKAQPADPKANGTDIPDEWTTGKGVNTASIDMKKAIRNIQAILNKNGFDAGAPDGTMGDKTVAALKSFQKSVGLPSDGRVTDQVVKELLARNK